MLVKFQNYERENVYINPKDITHIAPCGGNRPLSFITTRFGEKIQVMGTPDELVNAIEKACPEIR